MSVGLLVLFGYRVSCCRTVSRMWLRYRGRIVDAALYNLWTWREELSLYSRGKWCYSVHDRRALSDVVGL